jgi:hypothetical protein
MYGSFVNPKIAGIESSANTKSVKAIATNTIVKGHSMQLKMGLN